MKKYKVVDIFSGIGSFHLGFQRANFNIIFSTDNNIYCEESHKFNFPNINYFNKDILDIDEKFLNKHLKYKTRSDVLIGGPPCQGFSTIGSRVSSDPLKRKKKDLRNNLVFEFVRILAILKPKIFLMENVRGILTRNQGIIFAKLMEEFDNINYFTKYAIVNAKDYGVAQNRERVFVIGSSKKINLDFPLPTHGNDRLSLKPYVTIKDVISDLKDIEDSKNNHVPLKHKEKNLKRYKLIPEGGRMPEHKLSKELYRKNFGNTFKRLNRNEPSLAMVPGHNAFPIHPWYNRSLTAREAARIQSIPDKIKFFGPRHEQCIQVGNAVPTILAYKFAIHIKKLLKKNYDK